MRSLPPKSIAEIIWIICFLLLCLYPPTLFGKVVGLFICVALVVV
ncbi:hypothetical protein LMG29542_07265 [Paraburkholderia humisilvae]|uniref:Uncharacterized protein n=1 Tax=Paraburkholderia humisilvae TaxID=627669 RepID=A0A6J5F4V7_9BURK|nr:hypothetical protein LMG29542_07265 [Paraburkholderia humisilvae]